MKRLILIIPIFLFAACEMLVDIEMPYKDPQMVVNILARTDSTWLADISVSENSLDDPSNFDSVTNATVIITDQTVNQSVTLQHYRSGRYRGTTKPLPGHAYSIEVRADGFETVTASTIAPPLSTIKKAVWDTTRRIKHRDGDHIIDVVPVEITFSDPGNEKNSYETDVYELVAFVRPDPANPTVSIVDSTWSFIPTYINDPALVINNDFYNTDTYNNRFSDDSFNGADKNLTILVMDYGFHFGRYGLGVRLFNQNEDYMRYVDGRNLQRTTDRNPFAQPAPVYSNFSNTFGIFGIETVTVVEWRKE